MEGFATAPSSWITWRSLWASRSRLPSCYRGATFTRAPTSHPPGVARSTRRGLLAECCPCITRWVKLNNPVLSHRFLRICGSVWPQMFSGANFASAGRCALNSMGTAGRVLPLLNQVGFRAFAVLNPAWLVVLRGSGAGFANIWYSTTLRVCRKRPLNSMRTAGRVLPLYNQVGFKAFATLTQRGQ